MKKKYFFVFLMIATTHGKVAAQVLLSDSLGATESISLQQLINMEASGVSSDLEKEVNASVEAASKNPLSLRKSPSIISILSEEDITKFGVRDLLDLLRHVPGLDFGIDVQGAVTLSIRGNAATEGKVLLLLDGMEINELMYSAVQLANRVPVELIKRIEIIRGPGSAIYGGFAEYGVINIITKTQEISGLQAGLTYGQMQDGMARQNISVLGGHKQNSWHIAGAAWAGQMQQGRGQFIDFYDNRFSLKKQQTYSPKAVNINAGYKNFSINSFLESYDTKIRDGYDQVLSKSYANNFKTFIIEAKYKLALGEKIHLDTRLSYKNQNPWHLADNMLAEAEDTSGAYFIYQRSIKRYKANTTLHYDVTKKINFISGIEYYRDEAKSNERSGAFYDDSYRLKYSNIAAFSQGLFKFRWANITVGARFDKHSKAGAAFAPRLGVTKKYDKLHFKLLYGNSFRAPGIENINFSDNGNIKPEKSTVVEFEAGYQLTDDALFTVSVFDIETKRPIIYVTEGIQEFYKNVSAMGTQGFEAEYRYKSEWGFVTANYSFYSNTNKAKVAIYDVADQKGANLAAAQHKFNFFAGINLNKNITLSPNANLLGKRYGYVPFNDSGVGQLKSFEPVVLLNLSAKYNNFFVKGLSVSLGIYNLLNAENPLIFTYYSGGGHAPMPNNPREAMIRLIYQY